jgi:hypothetical protein
MVLSLLVAVTPVRAQGSLAATPTDSIQAQVATDTASVSAATIAPREAVGAPLTGLRAGVHLRETVSANQPLTKASTPPQQAKAMMIVGVAALLAGAIIGHTSGNVIMVGGTVVGLIGLFEYLQQ